MRHTVVMLFCLFVTGSITAQTDSIAPPKDNLAKDAMLPGKIYRMHPKYQLPAAGVTIILSTLGFHALDENARMSAADVMKLNVNDINAFDRPTALLNPSGFANAVGKAQFFLNFSLVSPVVLALDKHMRKDWMDLLTLYLASQAVDNMLYFAAIATVRRPRPMAYDTYDTLLLPLAKRAGSGMSKSFFSGHVSFSATATFFAVKAYTDYHHIKGWPRLLLYSAAAVPPILVGYFRVVSGRHFKTDVITGFISGAASGILVPELFRNKNKEKKNHISLTPYYMQDGGGVSMTVKL